MVIQMMKWCHSMFVGCARMIGISSMLKKKKWISLQGLSQKSNSLRKSKGTCVSCMQCLWVVYSTLLTSISTICERIRWMMRQKASYDNDRSGWKKMKHAMMRTIICWNLTPQYEKRDVNGGAVSAAKRDEGAKLCIQCGTMRCGGYSWTKGLRL